MIDRSVLSAAFGPVRDLVRADGGDLVIDRVVDTTARLRLVLDSAECRECVMPRDFLERVALDMLQREVTDLTAVTIHDPREV